MTPTLGTPRDDARKANLRARATAVASDGPPRARDLGLVLCRGCGLVCAPSWRADLGERAVLADDESHCPRCAAQLDWRKPGARGRAWAFLLAGLVLYVPANVLPVMSTTLFGQESESTLLGGVLDFWDAGDGGIATIIFIASVLVPCTKFAVLGALLLGRGHDTPNGRRARSTLYRLVEQIGYGSMLDVVVVAIVAASVQFGAFNSAEAREGILYFGASVIFTMLAALSYDARAIWDERRAPPRRRESARAVAS